MTSIHLFNPLSHIVYYFNAMDLHANYCVCSSSKHLIQQLLSETYHYTCKDVWWSMTHWICRYYILHYLQEYYPKWTCVLHWVIWHQMGLDVSVSVVLLDYVKSRGEVTWLFMQISLKVVLCISVIIFCKRTITPLALKLASWSL